MHKSIHVIMNHSLTVVIPLKMAQDFLEVSQKTRLRQNISADNPYKCRNMKMSYICTKSRICSNPYICTKCPNDSSLNKCTKCVLIYGSTNVQTSTATQISTNVAAAIQRHFSTFAPKHAAAQNPTNVQNTMKEKSCHICASVDRGRVGAANVFQTEGSLLPRDDHRLVWNLLPLLRFCFFCVRVVC